MYVCICNAVTDRDIRRAVNDGVECFEQLQMRTGCATCCGCCEFEARRQLLQTLADTADVMPLAA